MVPMNATVKWIGGGTLALAFGLGALAFGSTMLDNEQTFLNSDNDRLVTAEEFELEPESSMRRLFSR